MAGSSAVTVAYRAAGRLKWAARYTSPYGGFAAGTQIVAAPGGGAVYVGGRESAPSKHVDMVALAYRTATGQRMWRDQTLGGVPDIAVTPDGKKVIVDGSRNYTHIAIAVVVSGRSRREDALMSDPGRGRGSMMAGQIPAGGIHHLRLTVTDLQRSREFYTTV
ncbi:MAG: VOC family protein, partial [Streptosporangiaceae bacterium]